MSESRRLNPGIARIVIGGLLLIGTIAALLFTGPSSEHAAIDRVGPIHVEAPPQIDAGSPFMVTVTAEASNETSMQLAIFAPVNTTLLEAPLLDGQASFSVSQRLTEHAGSLQLVARVGTQDSPPKVLLVVPLTAVDPVVPLVGPRTIIADGSDVTMTVVTPTDRFGNPLQSGTPVTIEVLRPNGERTQLADVVSGGLASALIGSTTETGRVTISSSVDDADGPSNTVDQVAGVPAEFTIQIDSRNAIADGFALHEVQTSELRDRFGNLLGDGVSATFIVESAAGTSLIYSVVQGSIARAVVEAPDGPGEITIRARVSGRESLPVAMAFEPAVDAFPALMASGGNGTTIAIGPALTIRGGYVPDGTVVTIEAAATGAVVAEAELRGGTAQLDFEESLEQKGPLDAMLLGATTRVLTVEGNG